VIKIESFIFNIATMPRICEIAECGKRPSFGLLPTSTRSNDVKDRLIALGLAESEEFNLGDDSQIKKTLMRLNTSHLLFNFRIREFDIEGFLESLMAEQEAALDSDEEEFY
jgi:hypothetical protein